jgi:integrase-like protein
VAADLAAAVPPVAGWRDTTLPSVPAGLDVSALVAGCDRSRPAGLRDHAILLLLARLGLRSCEVARMELGDLDWRAGLLRVRGKGWLPLPADVGEAIAAYLRDGRPRAESRAVFLTLLAPVRPIGPCSVGDAVTRGCERTGQRPVGPIGCAVRSRSTWCAVGRPCPRSARCSATGTWPARRYTPRWTSPPFTVSPGAGRERDDARFVRPGRRLPAPAPCPRAQAVRRQPPAAPFRRLPRRHRRRDGDRRSALAWARRPPRIRRARCRCGG